MAKSKTMGDIFDTSIVERCHRIDDFHMADEAQSETTATLTNTAANGVAKKKLQKA